jgi:hypothetical protein
VVANCINALNEILAGEGGMAINRPIIHHLLNRMKEFNEWSQCVVLELVSEEGRTEQGEASHALAPPVRRVPLLRGSAVHASNGPPSRSTPVPNPATQQSHQLTPLPFLPQTQVARYKPESPQETFDVMNLLEERLKHSNSAVVLGATKVFLHLTQDMPQVGRAGLLFIPV